MNDQEMEKRIREARQIVEQLHTLLHEDALHRLDLYQKYAHDPDGDKWSPDLYKRCQLIDALRRKLDSENIDASNKDML